MGDCTGNDGVAPGTIISRCNDYIRKAFAEGWGEQYTPYAYFFMAKAKNRQGKTDEAEKFLAQAVRMAPDYFEAWRLLVVLSMNVPETDADMKALDLMISRNPKNPEVLNSACWIRASDGLQLDAAMADCNEAIRLDPKNAEALDSRGFVNFRMANYPAAIADYTAALAIDSKQASSLYMRGIAEAKQGNKAASDADVAAAKAIDPQVSAGYDSMGIKTP
jgi:tetratricopeptide (TPR) repeat protein